MFFAPRPALELFRTLHRDGKLIVAIPAYQHLGELRDALGLLEVDRNKELRVARALDPFFRQLEGRSCRWDIKLSHQQIAHLVGMGPSARHIHPAALARRIEMLSPTVSVTAEVETRIYVRRQAT
jgi:23S rRNA (guanine745-N1)-methyltransferase